MFVIGVDPHKGSHTAAALSSTEEVMAEVRVDADAKQLERLLEWAEPFSPRRWAIEGAASTGALLARQLVAVGEEVVDVAPTLSARVQLLDRGRSAKTDAHDARATAIVALRHTNLRHVVVEDHGAVLPLLADRHHDLVAQRTRVVCRLHALLAQLREGGASKGLSADRAAQTREALSTGRGCWQHSTPGTPTTSTRPTPRPAGRPGPSMIWLSRRTRPASSTSASSGPVDRGR